MTVRLKKQSLISLLATVALLSASAASYAAKQLNLAQSSLHFMSTKNEHITEQHTFEAFSGSIEDNGQLNIKIDLSSVETIIPIRNQRMREMLFDVASFPSATFSAKVDPSLVNLDAGEHKTTSVTGQLTLKDKTQDVTLDLVLVGLKGNAVKASTAKPIVLNTQALGVQEGIDALQSVAMLNSISKTVPVSFSVVFE